MIISVIGTGYVGLVSGACLAAKGHTVICVDVDADKVARINRAEPPIHEAGLDALLQDTAGTTLTATTDLRSAVLQSEVSLIAVGTPFNGDTIDLDQIRTAARQIGTVLREKDAYHTVIVKSTVVPGTTEDVVGPVLEDASGKTAGVHFGLGMNPEFLREGEAVADFMHPDRIVLGGINARTLGVMQALYDVFDGVDVITTGPRTAETIKYAANSLLATLISFSNEIGNLCAALGDVDVVDVMEGVHLDKRFMPLLEDGTRVRPGFISYLAAGCGFGGSCFPKDVKALVAHGQGAGVPMEVLDAVLRVNAQQPGQVIQLLKKELPSLSGRTVAVLGLAFKPGTDDVRESPALPVVQALRDEGALVQAYDPIASEEAAHVLGHDGITYAGALANALDGADAVVLMTRWPAFDRLPEHLAAQTPTPLVVDGRRMLPSDAVPRYVGIGWRPEEKRGAKSEERRAVHPRP